MKLNPPASSSDLDAARAVARRLHRRAQGHERATDAALEATDTVVEPTPPSPVSPSVTAAVLEEDVVSPPPPFEPAPSEPDLAPPEPEPVALEPPPEVPEAGAPLASEPELFEPGLSAPEPTATEPEAPSVLEPDLPEAPTPEEPAEPEISETLETPDDEESPPDFPADVDVEPPAEAPETEEPSSSDAWASQATPAEGITAPPVIDAETALGALTGSDGGILEGLEPPAEAASPEDLLGGAEPGWPGGSPLEEEIETAAEPDGAPEVVAPSTPSWDDVADSCLAVAGAHGAMLVDPSGQVLSARGDWPEPGPEAIGSRLVSMMEKTLQDAPTRSVSAPLAGRHLTAWRVPAGQGFYTIVFMGDAPLGADVRSPVDVEIKRALGQ